MTARDRELAARLDRFDREEPRGTRETAVNPNTMAALERRGWLTTAMTTGRNRARRRMVATLTDAGATAATEWAA